MFVDRRRGIIYFWGFTVFDRCFKSLNNLSKIPKSLNKKYKNNILYFSKIPPKNFFRRPQAGDLGKPNKIPCRTGRRESYRVILVGRGEGGRRPPEKNFFGGVLGFCQKGFWDFVCIFFEKTDNTKYIHTF